MRHPTPTEIKLAICDEIEEWERQNAPRKFPPEAFMVIGRGVTRANKEAQRESV